MVERYRKRWQQRVRGLREPERSITLLSFIIKRLQRKGRLAETHTVTCVCLASPLINYCMVSCTYPLDCSPFFLLLSNIIFPSSFTATQLSMHIITCTFLLPQTNPSYLLPHLLFFSDFFYLLAFTPLQHVYSFLLPSF